MGWRTRLFDLAAILLFAAALAAVGSRCWLRLRPVEDPQHPSRTALCDFQDVVYYPACAAMAGVNPYDARSADEGGVYHSRFPAGNSFPLYSPLIFVVSLPLAILPLTTAELLYWIFNVGLLVLYSYLLLRLGSQTATAGPTCALAALLLLSRPGHANAYFGSITLLLVLATLGAWWLADRRPWLSAALVALACIKPTFGGPLFVLLLLRGSFKAAIGGIGIGILANVVTLAIFLPHILDTENLAELLTNNQAVIEDDPAVDPLQSASRVDLLVVIERLVGRHFPDALRMALTFAVLIVAGIALRRSAKSTAANDHGRQIDSLALASLTITICIYHNIYDALLVAPAAMAAFVGLANGQSAAQRRARCLALVCLAIPAVNYYSSRQFLAALGGFIPPLASITEQPIAWTFLCMLNGICLTIAWCIFVAACFRDGNIVQPLHASK